jgi:hypothetical protein
LTVNTILAGFDVVNFTKGRGNRWGNLDGVTEVGIAGKPNQSVFVSDFNFFRFIKA